MDTSAGMAERTLLRLDFGTWMERGSGTSAITMLSHAGPRVGDANHNCLRQVLQGR